MTVNMDEYSVANTIPNNTQVPSEQTAIQEVVETAKFDSDRVVVQKTLVNTMSPQSGDMASISESRSHEIRNFLGRPVVLRQLQWTLTDPVMTNLTTLTLPDDLISHAMYKEKLRGFLGFRADIVIRVQINAQRFQQGRLMLCWLPQGQLLGVRAEVAHSDLTFCTQLPRIDFDLATDTDVSLRIPYVSPTLMYNMATGLGPFGTFKLFVYSPFVAVSGPNFIEVTVFGHFENVELEFPAFVSQGGDFPMNTPRSLRPDDEPPKYTLSRRLTLRDNILSLVDMLDDRQLIYVRNHFRDLKRVNESPLWVSQCGDIPDRFKTMPRKRSRASLSTSPPVVDDVHPNLFDLGQERRRAIYFEIETIMDTWSDRLLETAHDWLASFVPKCSTFNLNRRVDLVSEARSSRFESQAGKMSKSGNGRGPTRSEPSAVEAMQYGVGPISGALNRVSLASRILGEIPLLTSITGPVSWATAIMSRAATAFGFSKPRSAGAITKQHINGLSYINNSDGQTTAHSMGLLADNHVTRLPGFAGTDNDEMSMSYMLSIPTWFRTVSWGPGFVSASPLFSIPLNLVTFEQYLGASSTYNFYAPTPVAFLRRYFAYWRGGLCFKFKFVKTEFHTGRLMFVFNPTNIVNPSFSDTEFMYKEIVDIRESNEFTVTVPYAQVVPYLDTIGGQNGFLRCYVLNPLVAPETVPPDINILMEMHAAEDFEFAFPCPPTATAVAFLNKEAPVAPLARLAPIDEGTVLKDEDENLSDEARDAGLVSQALGENAAENEHTLQPATQPENIGSGSPAASGGLASSLACIGEKILSIRQLLNRSIAVHYNLGGAWFGVEFNPFEIQLPVAYTNTIQNSPMAVDYYSTFSSLFAYKRGSVRMTAVPARVGSSANGLASSLRANLMPKSSTTSFRSPRNSDVRLPWNVCNEAFPTNPGISVEIPQYTRTHSTLNRLSTVAAGDPTDTYAPNAVVAFRIALTGAAPTTFYRSIAEDFQLGFFIGTVPQCPGNQDGQIGQNVEW